MKKTLFYSLFEDNAGGLHFFGQTYADRKFYDCCSVEVAIDLYKAAESNTLENCCFETELWPIADGIHDEDDHAEWMNKLQECRNSCKLIAKQGFLAESDTLGCSGQEFCEALTLVNMDVREFKYRFDKAETLEDAVAWYEKAREYLKILSHHDKREANQLCCRLLCSLAGNADLTTHQGRQAFVDAAEAIAAPWQILSASLETVKDVLDEEGEYECIDSAEPGEPGSYEVLSIDGADGGVQWDNEVPDTLAHILDLNYQDRDGRYIWYNSKEA